MATATGAKQAPFLERTSPLTTMDSLFARLNNIKVWKRLVVATLATVALMWAGFLGWANHEQHKLAVDQARDFATSVHQMTMAGLTGMMITGPVGARALFLDQIKQSNHVKALKVYRSDAVVGQFGRGREGELPEDPDEVAVLKSGNSHFEVVRRGDEQRLKAILPAIALDNYLGKNCLVCHHVPAGTVLGAVSMEISLERAVASEIDFTRRAILAALLLCIPLGLASWYFTRRLVTRPLERMTAGLNRIAEGEIEDAAALPRRGSDEIGQATQAFNRVMNKAQELIKEQQLSRIVFYNAIEGITVTDAKSRIQMVNQAFVDTTGYSHEEVIGQTPALLKSGRQDEDFYQNFWKTLLEKGEWRGEIWNKRKNGTVYPEWLNVSAVTNRKGVIEHYIAIFSDITERKQREEMITYQAFHDALTTLPNRILFRDRLEQAVSLAKRHKYRTPAVMFIDLDRFKEINDTLGHDAGDELLKEVAERLRSCVRESDTVARMGGDEFTVLLPEIGHEDDARAVGEKILDMLGKSVTLAGTEVFVTGSIGVSMFPRDGREPDTLMKHADAAMYEVKAAGRAGLKFFTSEMIGKPSRRLELEARLARAIENKEFELYYQPIFDLGCWRIGGVEALLRWRVGPEELLPPEDFLGIAEETGLIVDIGAWVLDTACHQIREWRVQDPTLTLAINLSARQFHRIETPQLVGAALERCALPATALALELAEPIVMRDVDFASRMINTLAAQGTAIAIDDFGTGFSSLPGLARIAVESIKIDRSLIRDCAMSPKARNVIAALIGAAHALDLEVTAEGVETEAQLELLRDLGCDRAQGFLLQSPAPVAAISDCLAGAAAFAAPTISCGSRR